MQNLLSQENIELIENFIATNEQHSSDFLPAISEKYREYAIESWNYINDIQTSPTSYIQFAEGAYGMSSYGFYKSKNERVFLINAFCNQPISYYDVPPTWNILIPYDELIKQIKNN